MIRVIYGHIWSNIDILWQKLAKFKVIFDHEDLILVIWNFHEVLPNILAFFWRKNFDNRTTCSSSHNLTLVVIFEILYISPNLMSILTMKTIRLRFEILRRNDAHRKSFHLKKKFWQSDQGFSIYSCLNFEFLNFCENWPSLRFFLTTKILFWWVKNLAW